MLQYFKTAVGNDDEFLTIIAQSSTKVSRKINYSISSNFC